MSEAENDYRAVYEYVLAQLVLAEALVLDEVDTSLSEANDAAARIGSSVEALLGRLATDERLSQKTKDTIHSRLLRIKVRAAKLKTDAETKQRNLQSRKPLGR